MIAQKGCSLVLLLVVIRSSCPAAAAQESAVAGAQVVHPALKALDEEKVPADECDAIADLENLIIGEMSRSQDGKPTERDQHPKHHGFVVAKFRVLDNLPRELRVGLFREPRPYSAVIRFSNTAERADSTPDNHGMALKVLGVEGKKALDDEKDPRSQDFVLIDHPLFFARDVATLVEASKLNMALQKNEALQKDLKDLLPAQAAEVRFQAFAQKMPREAMIIKLRKKLIPSPLAAEYFSTTPYRFGETAVKYSAKPERISAPIRTKREGVDYLREAMVEQLSTLKQPATFGFYIQRRGKRMPIEDPTVEWMSAWEKVAVIEIEAQDFDFQERREWGNGLSYNPWHALVEHEPLGGINRARKVIYPATSELRHRNLGPMKEPTEAEIPMKAPARN